MFVGRTPARTTTIDLFCADRGVCGSAAACLGLRILSNDNLSRCRSRGLRSIRRLSSRRPSMIWFDRRARLPKPTGGGHVALVSNQAEAMTTTSLGFALAFSRRSLCLDPRRSSVSRVFGGTAAARSCARDGRRRALYNSEAQIRVDGGEIGGQCKGSRRGHHQDAGAPSRSPCVHLLARRCQAR